MVIDHKVKTSYNADIKIDHVVNNGAVNMVSGKVWSG